MPAPASLPEAPPAAPDAGITATPIPRHVASVRRPWSYTITLAEVPSDVTDARFVAMARTAGRRWGLLPGRVSRTAQVVNGDDRTHVGFSWDLPEDALGVQTDAYWVRRHPGRRVCRTKLRAGRRVRSCTRLPGRVTRSLSDRDLAINAEVPWEEGPGRPGGGTWDLESVLVHELGHMAGNGHRARCVNSPMVAALAAGEWWRSPTDYFFGGCGLSRPSASTSRAAGAPGRLRLVHRVRDFDVTEAARAEKSAVRSARRRAATAQAVADRAR